MFIELRELLCSGAIRRHQLGGKRPLPSEIYLKGGKDYGYYQSSSGHCKGNIVRSVA